jgi:hypothetical protein
MKYEEIQSKDSKYQILFQFVQGCNRQNIKYKASDTFVF